MRTFGIPEPLTKLALDLACASPFKLSVDFGERKIITVSVSDTNNAVMSYVTMQRFAIEGIDGDHVPLEDLQTFHNNMIKIGMTVSASCPTVVYDFLLCTGSSESERMSKVLKEFALTVLHLDDCFDTIEKSMRPLGFPKPSSSLLITPPP